MKRGGEVVHALGEARRELTGAPEGGPGWPLAGWLHVSAIRLVQPPAHRWLRPLRTAAEARRLRRHLHGLEGGASGIDTPDPKALADALVSHGPWEEVEGGWQIHDFLEYQPSRESILAKRKKEH